MRFQLLRQGSDTWIGSAGARGISYTIVSAAMDSDNTLEMANEVCGRLLGDVSARIEDTLQSRGAEQVHRLRVAIRRFNQALSTFEFCGSPHAVRKIRKHLKKTMRLAGLVRNLDVAIKWARKWKLPDQDELEARRHEAGQEVTHLLERWVEREWASQFSIDSPQLGEESIQDHARRLLTEMAVDFFNRGNEAATPNATPSKMHGFRISAKKFRYTMEIFARAYAPVLNARIEQVKQLQTILGEINDCVTLRGLLPEDLSGNRLRQRQRRKTAEFRKQWNSQFGGDSIMEGWVEALGLLSSRKGPQKEHEWRSVAIGVRTLGQSRRRRAAGGG